MANPIFATPQPAPSGEAVTVTDAMVDAAHAAALRWGAVSPDQICAALEAALSTLPAAPQWRPISEYDKGKGEIVAVLDWFMYRTDPDKKRHPVRYVAQFVGDEAMWCDNDGMELDIDPTHFAHLPPLPAAPSKGEAQS